MRVQNLKLKHLHKLRLNNPSTDNQLLKALRGKPGGVFFFALIKCFAGKVIDYRLNLNSVCDFIKRQRPIKVGI